MKSVLMILSLLGLVLSSHGKDLPLLKISADQHYLVTENNEPFFWLGGTAWELIHRLTKEEIDIYLKDRAEKGFTIIQTVILAELDGLNTPNAYGNKPLIDNNPEQLNEKYFELVDYVINKANKLGMYVGLLPAWGDKFNLKWGKGPVIFNPLNAEVYGALLGKRYSKYNNIVWILGGDRMPESEDQDKVVRAMANGIRKHDTVHLLSYHPSGAMKATDAFNEDWLDVNMFQSGHDRRVKEYKFVLDSRKIKPTRPVIEAEPRYENSMERFWEPGEHDWMDDSDVRLTAYWTMLSGAAGYTYGCHDIWQMYAPGREPISNARTGWKEALHLPGSTQMLYLKKLFLAFPWQSMVNDQSLILNNNPEDHTYSISSIGSGGDFMIAYTPWGKPMQLDLSKLKGNKVNAFWFNPRSGSSWLISSFATSEKPTFTPHSSGRGSDYLVIILPESSAIQLPLANN